MECKTEHSFSPQDGGDAFCEGKVKLEIKDEARTEEYFTKIRVRKEFKCIDSGTCKLESLCAGHREQ